MSTESTETAPEPGYPTVGYVLNGYRLLAVVETVEAPRSAVVLGVRVGASDRPGAFVTGVVYPLQSANPKEWHAGNYSPDLAAAYRSLAYRASLPLVLAEPAVEPPPAPAADPDDARMIDLAHEQWGQDGIDIDADAVVSRGDDPGAYVAAWLWVRDPTADPEDD